MISPAVARGDAPPVSRAASSWRPARFGAPVAEWMLSFMSWQMTFVSFAGVILLMLLTLPMMRAPAMAAARRPLEAHAARHCSTCAVPTMPPRRFCIRAGEHAQVSRKE